MVETRPNAATHSENHCEGPARSLVEICSRLLFEHQMGSQDTDHRTKHLHDDVADCFGARDSSLRAANTAVTAGLKCAPEMGPSIGDQHEQDGAGRDGIAEQRNGDVSARRGARP